MLFKKNSKLNNCKHNSRHVGKCWVWVSERRSTKNMFNYRHRHSSPKVLIMEVPWLCTGPLGVGWELGMAPHPQDELL